MTAVASNPRRIPLHRSSGESTLAHANGLSRVMALENASPSCPDYAPLPPSSMRAATSLSSSTSGPGTWRSRIQVQGRDRRRPLRAGRRPAAAVRCVLADSFSGYKDEHTPGTRFSTSAGASVCQPLACRSARREEVFMATTMCEIDGRRPAVATVRIRQNGEERTIAVCEEHLRELQGQSRGAGAVAVRWQESLRRVLLRLLR